MWQSDTMQFAETTRGIETSAFTLLELWDCHVKNSSSPMDNKKSCDAEPMGLSQKSATVRCVSEAS